MWINEQLQESPEAEPPVIGRVTRAEGGRVDVSSYMPFAELPCVCGFGLQAAPTEGEQVLLIPTSAGYVCAGRLSDEGLPDGAVELRAPSGAYLRLRTDGCVEINGLIITPEGTPLAKNGGKTL